MTLYARADAPLRVGAWRDHPTVPRADAQGTGARVSESLESLPSLGGEFLSSDCAGEETGQLDPCPWLVQHIFRFLVWETASGCITGDMGPAVDLEVWPCVGKQEVRAITPRCPTVCGGTRTGEMSS